MLKEGRLEREEESCVLVNSANKGYRIKYYSGGKVLLNPAMRFCKN